PAPKPSADTVKAFTRSLDTAVSLTVTSRAPCWWRERVVARWLLLTQCFDGRHLRRAERRKQRRGEHCGEEDGRAEQQRSGIAGGDSVELRPYKPRGSPRARSANEHAGHGDRQTIPHDHPDDAPVRGAEGHAHTDFPSPRRHGV